MKGRYGYPGLLLRLYHISIYDHHPDLSSRKIGGHWHKSEARRLISKLKICFYCWDHLQCYSYETHNDPAIYFYYYSIYSFLTYKKKPIGNVVTIVYIHFSLDLIWKFENLNFLHNSECKYYIATLNFISFKTWPPTLHRNFKLKR